MRSQACALPVRWTDAPYQTTRLEVDVPRRILADPLDGVPGTIEDDGRHVRGTYYMAAYVYGPEEAPPAGMDTLSKFRALHGSPTQQSLVVPFTGDTKFTFGPEFLSLPDDRVIVLIEFSSADSGPQPEVCSCGKLSVRHAVSYHDSHADRAPTALF